MQNNAASPLRFWLAALLAGGVSLHGAFAQQDAMPIPAGSIVKPAAPGEHATTAGNAPIATVNSSGTITYTKPLMDLPNTPGTAAAAQPAAPSVASPPAAPSPQPAPPTTPESTAPAPSAAVAATPATPTEAPPAPPAPANESSAPASADTPAPPARVIYTPKTSVVNPQTGQRLLEEPLQFDPAFSIMFTESDMRSVVIPGLALYDKSGRPESTGKNVNEGAAGDDLTGLLQSLQGDGMPQNSAEKLLPNLYLGSIVYYTPTNWSIWLNGKKLLSRLNSKSNTIYVQAINRSEVTLTWKPPSLQDVGNVWSEKSSPPNTPPKNIKVDEANGTITLNLRPNQTFETHAVRISEGLIKQEINASGGDATATPSAMPATVPAGNTPPVPPRMGMRDAAFR